MLEIDQNIEGVESWDPGSGGKVTPGVYEAVIETVEVKTSTTGFPKIAMKFKVVQGDCMGGIVFGDRSLHPNALPYFRGLMDLLNVYANGRSIDEQKLVGRYCKVHVAEYDKNDGTKGVSVEKYYVSDINAHKNEQLDISAGANKGVRAGERVAPPVQAAPAHAAAPQKRNGTVPPAPAAPQKKNSDQDLPF